MRERAARRRFFAIRPVCAKVALGAATLDAAELETIRVMSARSEETLRAEIANARRFATGDDAVLPPAARAAVLERLGQYGVLLAARAVRAGANDREQLARNLASASGMTELAGLIVRHFGNRALLIKLERLVGELRALCLRVRQAGGDAARSARAVDDALAVLRRYYEGALVLDDAEVDELLRVTGESGTSLAQRLGADDGASPQT